LKKILTLVIIFLMVLSTSSIFAPEVKAETSVLVKQWNYKFSPINYFEVFCPSPAIANLLGGPELEIVTGTDEWHGYQKWHAFNYDGTHAWILPTGVDESRSSVAIADIDLDGDLEIIGGTTSGWQLQVITHEGKFIWKFSDGYAFWRASPAVADLRPDITGLEIVAATYQTQRIWCFDKSGNALWSYTIPGGYAYSTPAIADVDNDGELEIIIGVTNGKIYSFNKMGGVEWEYTTGAAIFSSAAIADLDADPYLEIIIGSNDGKIYCLDGKSGSLQWSYKTGGAVYSSPSIGDVDADGSYEIIVGSDDGKIYCLDKGGVLEWSYTTGGAVRSSPALANRGTTGLGIYIGSMDKYLYLLDGQGKLIDRFYTGATNGITSSPAVADVDGDNKLEVLFTDWNAVPNTWTTNYFWCLEDTGSNVGKYAIEWQMFRRNPQRTGAYIIPILVIPYQELVKALPIQSPAFTETIVNPTFAGAIEFTYTYDSAVNTLQVTAPDFLMEIDYDTSMIKLNTPIIKASGYANPELGKNPPLISGSAYTYGQVGLLVYKHWGQDIATKENFDGWSVKIPIVGGGFTYATGDQGTKSASAETPVSDVLGAYVSVSLKDTYEGSVVGGLSGGVGVASVSGGLGGYWETDAWGLKLNGDVEVDIVVGQGGADGNLHINLKPVADFGVAVGNYILEGGKYVADKVKGAIGKAKEKAGDFIKGVKNWFGKIMSPIPPMPEDVNMTFQIICKEFVLELYEVLTTTPLKAKHKATNLTSELIKITDDVNIQNRLYQILTILTEINDDFSDEWRVKSIFIFDRINDAVYLIDESINIAQQTAPDKIDCLLRIREKLIDIAGLLAGDICYDAKVEGGIQEWITKADEAFKNGNYKNAYKYALLSLSQWPYVYEDAQRGTVLKINPDFSLFQFIKQDKDFGIRKATTMYEGFVTLFYNKEYTTLPTIIIRHEDNELLLVAYAGTDIPFCYTIAKDLQTGKRYRMIIDPPEEVAA